MLVRILTTHVGSLPAVAGAQSIEDSVAEVVARQRDTGLDIINEGEYTKNGDWLSFADGRFGGFEAGEPPATPIILQGKDRQEFADFYRYASERGLLFYTPGEQIRSKRVHWVCTARVTYTGQEPLAREIELLKKTAGSKTFFSQAQRPEALKCIAAIVITERRKSSCSP